MKFNLRNPFCVLGLVVAWRIAILIFTAQPIPADDASFFDGAMTNWILHGHYFNPGLSAVFPISGHEVYAAYPPLYQVALLIWMKLFGASVISVMALHTVLFTLAASLVVHIVRALFPATPHYASAVLLLFAVTFDDRPEGLAHNFGLLALLLIAQGMAVRPSWMKLAGIALLLWGALYTSVIVGALYFGVGFIAVALACCWRRQFVLFVPFAAAAALFVVITVAIARFEPLWWAGFRENARQTPVLAQGFRLPNRLEIIKLIRNVPVFLVALAALPVFFARRKQIFAQEKSWLALVAGVFVMGWILLVADMTLLAANYVGYVLYLQVLLAAGLLAACEISFPAFRRELRVVLVGCVILASVRAVGMSTWGAACAWKNSYARTHETLRAELEPFAKTNAPVIVSSAYFYTALEMNVENPVHADWYFDRANWTNNADVNGLITLRPPKLVLVQFDYYRAFKPLLEQLEKQPDLVSVRIRDEAAIRPPDSIPSFQRVVQHISWAPVIVDLDWK